MSVYLPKGFMEAGWTTTECDHCEGTGLWYDGSAAVSCPLCNGRGGYIWTPEQNKELKEMING